MQKRITLELEVGEANELVETWEKALAAMNSDKADIERRISLLQNKIASVRAKLTGQELLPEKGNPRQPGTGTTTERTPKGRNLKVIQGFLKSVTPAGKTATEIARQTNIGVTSVYAVLKRHEKFFKKGEEGLWSMK